MTRAIDIRDVGPVEHLSIPIPDGGGLVVLRGSNGSGKSHALQAVSSLIGGTVRPVSRDGSLGANIDGLGTRITLGRKLTRNGELDVVAIDGEDPSTLVDGGNHKSPEAADAERMRALLRLANVKVEPEMFAGLVGGMDKLREYVPQSVLENRDHDIPAMAAAIKRALEGEARKREQAADGLFAKAEGIRETVVAMGHSDAPIASLDSADARERHTAAVREHSAAEARSKQAEQTSKAAQDARAALEALADDGTTEALGAALDAERDAAERVTQLRERLAAAISEHELASVRALQQRKAAEQRVKLQKAVESAAAAEPVAAEALAALAAAVQAAAAEVEAWAVRDKAKGLLEQVEALRLAGTDESSAAVLLRSAARGTEGVVLKALAEVCGDDLELHDGRLYVTNSDRGERELFADLSHGERWRRALDIAAVAVGAKGVLSCKQEAYESLDPVNRRELADYLRKLGVVMITAEAADGDLRAEVA